MKSTTKPLLGMLAFSLLAAGGHVIAQTYSIDRFVIAGGGGTSSGGPYSLSGTIGQHDAGTMSGGAYTLHGGFWSVVSVVQTPGAPTLSIENLPNGDVRVFWPRPATGFVLDQTGALTGSPTVGWTPVSFAYQTNATDISVIVTPGAGHTFFRLRKP